MSETWYRVSKYSNDISEVDVLSSTQHFIVVKQSYGNRTRREAKSDSYHTCFPTRDEAKRFLSERLVRTIERLKRELVDSEYALEKLNRESD